jgi:hypothetical protein
VELLKLAIARPKAWLDSPAIRFVQVDDGSWNMFCDDLTSQDLKIN